MLPVLVVYRTLCQVPGDADPAGWGIAAERLAAQADLFRIARTRSPFVKPVTVPGSPVLRSG